MPGLFSNLPYLNEALCWVLKQPEFISVDKKIDEIGVEWLADFKQIYLNDRCHPCVEFHLGSESTYIFKRELNYNLYRIYKFLLKSNQDTVNSIMMRLEEGIENCTEGFYDRVNDLILQLSHPSTLVEFLTVVRADLVERVARSVSGEIHSYNHVFRIANHYELGVTIPNEKDVFTAGKYDFTIIQNLYNLFKGHYTVLGLIDSLTNKLFSELEMKFGYIGLNKEGYKNGVYDKSMGFIAQLLSTENSPVELPYADYLILDEDSQCIDLDRRRIKLTLFQLLYRNNYFTFTEKTADGLGQVLLEGKYNAQLLPLLSNNADIERAIALLKDEFEVNKLLIGIIVERFNAFEVFPLEFFLECLKKKRLVLSSFESIMDDLLRKGVKLEVEQFFDKDLYGNSLYNYSLTTYPILFEYLLRAIKKLSDQDKFLFFYNEYKGHPTFLMYLVINQPTHLAKMTHVIDELAIDKKISLLTKTNAVGDNVFFQALTFRKLGSFKTLIKLVERLDISQISHILQQSNNRSQGFLEFVLSIYPDHFELLVNLLLKLDFSARKKLILRGGGNKKSLLNLVFETKNVHKLSLLAPILSKTLNKDDLMKIFKPHISVSTIPVILKNFPQVSPDELAEMLKCQRHVNLRSTTEKVNLIKIFQEYPQECSRYVDVLKRLDFKYKQKMLLTFYWGIVRRINFCDISTLKKIEELFSGASYDERESIFSSSISLVNVDNHFPIMMLNSDFLPDSFLNDLSGYTKYLGRVSTHLSMKEEMSMLQAYFLLFQLKIKYFYFHEHKYHTEFEAAKTLHTHLFDALYIYDTQPKTEETKKAFHSSWTDAIHEARPHLEKHRGWKDFFAKLVCILTIIPALVHACRNHGFFSEPLTKTNTAKSLDVLESTSDLMARV